MIAEPGTAPQVFGLPLGLLAVWMGATIGETLAFLLGRCSQLRCISYIGPWARPTRLSELPHARPSHSNDSKAAVRRFLFREFVAEQTARHEWWQAVEHAIEHEGWKIVLLLRLTPLVPFNLLNYALACTAVRFWDYTWASSVGVLPGMVCRHAPFVSARPSFNAIPAGCHEVANIIAYACAMLHLVRIILCDT